ncbi:MAG TPA: hypothetical protein VMU17_02260 [Elusimicrobiota bacterium]|nr:hypothetical protein [Elusimicrobiota bacterium]
MKTSWRAWRLPVMLTLLLGAGWFFHLPSPVRDAVTEQPAAGWSLHLAPPYYLLAPWCSIADHLTVMSLPEMKVFLLYAALAVLLIPRTWTSRAVALAVALAFFAWGAVGPRPMAKLVSPAPEMMLIDMHSHTAYSHDGRKGFQPSDNMDWHRRQGFNAAFITDHNTAAGGQEAKRRSEADWRVTGYRSLQGDEASLYRTHLCVYAPHERIDNQPFDSAPARIPDFIAAMHRRGYLVTANLPEYWRFHWKTGWMDFQSWDVDGFEIVNSAPRALDFPIARRRDIIALCRRRNLFVDGVSDNHGWGSATAAWNAMRIPGWQELDPDQLESAVLAHLRRDRFQAFQVLERYKFFPENDLQLALSPLGNMWVWARSLDGAEAASCLLWFWGLAFAIRRCRLNSR